MTLEGMVNWVAPELEHVQSRLAAGLPYARASELLTLLLPADAGNSTSTLRRRTLAVGERLDSELQSSTDEASPADARPGSSVAMGLDCN